MKKIFSLSLIFVYVLLIPVFFSGCSCSKEENGLVIGDHYNYVSYQNLSYGDGDRQKMNLHIPKEKTGEVGLMLFIHGGAWVAGDKSAYDSTLVDWCSGRGYVACAINYRYANVSTYVGDIMNDITAAMIKIKKVASQYGIDVTKALLSGGSAGGHLSLMYAYQMIDIAPIKPVAVVSLSGPTNLADANFLEEKSNRDDILEVISCISGYEVTMENYTDALPYLRQASPLTYVSEKSVPTVMCHGVNDDIVPYSNAQALKSRLDSFGVKNTLVTYPNSGHGLESDPAMATIANDLMIEYANTYLN